MPLRVETLDLSVPEQNRQWKQERIVNPGQIVTFGSSKIEEVIGGLGGERWAGAVIMQAACAPDDSHSIILEVGRNSSGTIAETWDLMFNPPLPTLVRRLEIGEQFILTGRVSIDDPEEDFEITMEKEASKGMIRLTHAANFNPQHFQ